VASGLKFGTENVTYFGWFFPWDLAAATVAAAAAAGGGGMWTLRDLALNQCPPLLDTLVKDADGKTIIHPPTLPFAPPTSSPFQGGEDFLMSQIAVIIAPAFTLDLSTQRPSGHYVLMGSTSSNFHAESLLCTQYGIDGDDAGGGQGGGVGRAGWDPLTDCPPTAEGWPKPEVGREGGREGGGKEQVVEVTGKGKAVFGSRRWRGAVVP